MPARHLSDSPASVALIAPASRRAVEAALNALDPQEATLLRDRYLGARPPERDTPSDATAEAAALVHLATALDAVAPASDGTPWQAGSARGLLRMVGAGMRRGPHPPA
ncbi:MAG: hypothetical protein AAF624_03375 [Bacteroidota bacterium]